MKKFESTTHNSSTTNSVKTNNIGKILQVLPNIIEVLPKILGKNNYIAGDSMQTNMDIYYPNLPTPQQFRATQIRNTMDSIVTHQYLVSTLRHQNTISGNSPLFQQTDTSPNTPRRPRCLD